jgi:type IV pilus assembly protein PilB
MENVLQDSFLQHLITDKVLQKESLPAVLSEARCQETSLIDYLLQEKAINSLYLSRLLAKTFYLPFIDLDTIDLLRLPMHLIEETIMQKHQVLPLWQEKEKLGLAMADPTHHLAIEDVRFHTGLIIEKIIVEPDKLRRLLNKLLTKENFKKNKLHTTELISGFAQQNNPKFSHARSTVVYTELDKDIDNERVIIDYVYKLLQTAITQGASDVHLEPYQNELKIRFRIDGLLYFAASLPNAWTQRIITRLKIMSQLDIAEKRVPQDGRFQLMDDKNKKIDCRINTCPTLYGEKLVVRILYSNRMLLAIDQLGMNAAQKACFLQALHCPHGMILVTGPTGSGKTITLYTALNVLNTSHLNISSVENPVEIVLPGINQVNINPKVGLNFANVLRSFLRQDPDVIMLGEMRDQETAEIGIKAAQTGHLVLSSLHTNSAAESLVRLLNMGIASYNIASSINLIIAQRLARRLCPYCKVKENLPENILLELGLSRQEIQSVTLFSAKGCTQCTEGYCGRTGIFEMLSMTHEINRIILQAYDVRQIALHAQSTGMQTLYVSALEKLKAGEISLLEMKRIIKD